MLLMELQDIRDILDKPDKKIVLTFRQLDQRYYIKKIIRKFGKIEVYETLKQFPHPNMPKIYSITEDHDEIIVIEEFINGISLDNYIKEHTMTDEEITFIFLQLCDVVSHLHSFHPSIIHRDIKPGNVLFINKTIYLIDYDIAREYEEAQTKDTTVIGSVGYAAPEQYGFTQSDTRSDIYAMGVLLNELITGEYPNVMLVKDTRSKIIQKCIALDPDKRYQTINELKKEYCAILKVKDNNAIKSTPFEKYMLPGLRSSKKSKRVLSLMGYLGLFVLSLSSEVTSKTVLTPIDEVMFRLTVFSILLMMVFVPCNYLNILSFTPLSKSSHKLIRVLNGYFIFMLSMFVIIFGYALLSSILNSLL